jgi:hypothetical protein
MLPKNDSGSTKGTFRMSAVFIWAFKAPIPEKPGEARKRYQLLVPVLMWGG